MTLGAIVGARRDFADLAGLGYCSNVSPNDVSLIVNGARQVAAESDRQILEAGGNVEDPAPARSMPT